MVSYHLTPSIAGIKLFAVCLFVCLFGWLVGWLVGCLVGWLVGWLVGVVVVVVVVAAAKNMSHMLYCQKRRPK